MLKSSLLYNSNEKTFTQSSQLRFKTAVMATLPQRGISRQLVNLGPIALLPSCTCVWKFPPRIPLLCSSSAGEKKKKEKTTISCFAPAEEEQSRGILGGNFQTRVHDGNKAAGRKVTTWSKNIIFKLSKAELLSTTFLSCYVPGICSIGNSSWWTPWFRKIDFLGKCSCEPLGLTCKKNVVF